MDNGNQPATKADLAALESRVTEVEKRLNMPSQKTQ
jgi:hypothetical protein